MSVLLTTNEAVKASPPVAVVSLNLVGVQLQDWVLIVTLVYTLLQVYFLLRDRWWKQRKE
jgi:hypothetical protein